MSCLLDSGKLFYIKSAIWLNALFTNMKKLGLDYTDPSNYLSISKFVNDVQMSILIELLVLGRLRPHLLVSVKYNLLQLAYHIGHLAKMAIKIFWMTSTWY